MEYWVKLCFKLQSIIQKFIHTFQLSAVDLTLVYYMWSQFIVFLSFYSEYLFAEPLRYSQKPQMSYINCQGSRRKSGMTQSPLLRHWEMQNQQCYLQAFHVKMLTWNPQVWSNGMPAEIYG